METTRTLFYAATFALFSVIASIAFAADVETAKNDCRISATAALRDGSMLKGTLLTKEVKGAAIFKDPLVLNTANIKSLTFTKNEPVATVSLINGDLLSFNVATQTFELETSLGKLSISRDNVKSLNLAQRSSAGDVTESLIFHCTFDDQAAVETPAIGPAGRYLTGRFVEGKHGNALYIPTYTPCADFDLPANFLGPAGCIEMWIMIKNQSARVGAGGDPRLFCIFEKADKGYPILNIDFVNNDGGGNSGASAYSIGGHTSSISGMGYNLTYQQLLGKSDWRDWHHVALVWNIDGIPGMGPSRKTATFIDGEALPAPIETGRTPESYARLIAADYLLAFPFDPGQNSEGNSKSPFLIDEFKIWNYAKTEFDLQ